MTVRLAMALVGLMIAACSATVPPSPTSTPFVPTPIITTAAPGTSTLAASTRATATRSPIVPGAAYTVTLWMDDEIAPGSTSAGRVLRSQLDAFSAANPNIRIEITAKKASGKGGLLDFLSTTQWVNPSRLPDLVALDIADVPVAAEAGLLQTLDGLLPSDLNADLFPFAFEAAHYQSRWVSVPFASDVEHLVYNKTSIRKPPQNWDEFSKQKGTLLLPLAGDDAFLVQYLGLGATLSDASRQIGLDPNAAAQALGFFKRGHDLNLVPDSAIGLKTVEDDWPPFAAGQVSMAQVSASRYITERAKVPNALFAPVPTRDGQVATLATGWALGIVTKDTERQPTAARAVQWIVERDRIAPWLRAMHLIPTSRAGVALAVDPPDYASFLQDQMEHADLVPPVAFYAKQSEAWRAAVSLVWKGQLSPEEAARNAAAFK